MMLSTIEARYCAFTEATKEITGIKNLLAEFGVHDSKPILYFVTTKAL
jgi:hypothetical protein